MSVTPSPIAGFAGQFFDNNGIILSGGKIFTYAAGTTTPQASYTSASGTTPHANPIILDSAGRVPGGEIWLTDGLVYKFVIETSTNVLIGTYDNITGVNSNFVNYTVQEEVITATAGQTVFNLSTINYTPGTNSLSVYIDGVNQYVGDSYLETDGDTVTFTAGLHVGAEVKFTTAVQTTTGSVDASIVSYTYPAPTAVGQTVQERLAQYVSVKDFGAVGDSVTDDTAAVQAAVNYCVANAAKLRVPVGSYLINKITVDNTATPAWTVLDIEGESFETGSSLFQCEATKGPNFVSGSTFVTNGDTAFEIAFDNFFNESVRFKNISFYNKGARGLSAAIVVDKDTVSYPRAWSFEGMGYYNFDSCIALRGNDPSIFNNFFGSMTIKKQFPYLCGIGFQLIDAYVNLCHIDDCLYFGLDKGGIVFAGGAGVGASGGVVTIRNTHFEGCEPAGIVTGDLETKLALDNVSGETTGSVSGDGIIKRGSGFGVLGLTVSNSNYPVKGFVFMPNEFRLGEADTISASCPVNVSGYGWITDTPELVTPVVSNDPAYNQTDKSTFCLTPVHSNVGRVGERTYDKFAGWNSSAGISYTPPNSATLPNAIRSNFVGIAPGQLALLNITDTFTAPSDGYIYASWIAKYTAANNGFWLGNSQMIIDGVDVLTAGNCFGPGSYNFLVVAPIGSGEVLGRTELAMLNASSWSTGVYMTFETDQLDMLSAACGFPKSVSAEYTVATASTLTVTDYGDGATPFSIRVQLFFDGGQYGYKEYVITGDGAAAANRVYTQVASSVVAGIAVTTNAGPNAALYDISVANTTGSSVSVTKIVSFIS